MPNRVVHFEIEAKDKNRASKFYAEAFGWKMQQMGDDMGGYVVAQSDDPMAPMGINGGIFEVPNKEYNAFRCVIGVDNIEKAMEDVKKSGGKVLSEKPDDISTIGRFAKCEDTEGNAFAILEPSEDMKTQK